MSCARALSGALDNPAYHCPHREVCLTSGCGVSAGLDRSPARARADLADPVQFSLQSVQVRVVSAML